MESKFTKTIMLHILALNIALLVSLVLFLFCFSLLVIGIESSSVTLQSENVPFWLLVELQIPLSQICRFIFCFIFTRMC